MRAMWISMAAVGATLIGASGAQAAPPFCGPSERPCTRVVVPLDHFGGTPGSVRLQVEIQRARKPTLPPLLLLAGGPGQSATSVYDAESIRATLGKAVEKRDVVVFDQRGTGLSGALRCKELDTNPNARGKAAGACARRLGPRRRFFTTRDSVEDIEAVRRELGAPTIALLGTSYGTKVALGYALRYPSRVERLVLDSVVGDAGPTAFYTESMAAAPRVIRALCGAICRRFTRDPVRDLGRLAARLARGPVEGRLVDPRGRRRPARLKSFDLMVLLLTGDLDERFRIELPGAVRSAIDGDPAPILRLRRRARGFFEATQTPREFSSALFATTLCEESRLPWARTAPFADRSRQAAALVAGVPESAFAPFTRATALASDTLEFCGRWPSAATAPELGPGPLPDVPALVLAGEADTRTPLESARHVAAAFPQSELLVAANTGHDVIGADITGCGQRAAERFLSGAAPGVCRKGRERPPPRPSAPAPASLADLSPAGGVGGRPGRTMRAVELTQRDLVDLLVEGLAGELVNLLSGGGSTKVRSGGLRAGGFAYSLRKDTLVLKGFSYVPGVRVSGRIRRLVKRPRGRLRVEGRAAAPGTLLMRGAELSGRLGGRPVRLRLRRAERVSAAASAAKADQSRRPHPPIR